MRDDVVLCQQPRTTVAQLKLWLDRGERDHVAGFIGSRMLERYFRPVDAWRKDKKNGFAIMALSCLSIESLQSHRYGWPSTAGKSELAFCRFFDHEERFCALRGSANAFYKHVRCGILHQGETTQGWKIRRDGPLFDSMALQINATKFHASLRECVTNYVEEVRTSKEDAEIWKACRKKLKAIIENCSREGTQS